MDGEYFDYCGFTNKIIAYLKANVELSDNSQIKKYIDDSINSGVLVEIVLAQFIQALTGGVTMKLIEIDSVDFKKKLKRISKLIYPNDHKYADKISRQTFSMMFILNEFVKSSDKFQSVISNAKQGFGM